MDNANDPRIKVRTAYLDVLKKEMASSDKIRIQYANKFAGSSNYWKNSIGMNKAIIDNKVLDTKAQQEKAFEKFAKNKPEYQGVVDGIEKIVTKEGHSNYRATTVSEIGNAVELTKLASLSPRMDAIKNDLNKKDEAAIQKDMAIMKIVYQNFNNKDYDVNVDRKVAKALLPLMAQMLPAEELPDIYTVINTKYNGDFNKFVDDMYDHSIFTSQANFDAFIKSPTAKALDEDLSLQYAASAWKTIQGIYFKKNTADDDNLALLHKKYIRGLNEMKKPAPAYPDANFTMRLTYGNVKSYNPKDGVTYRYYTTTDGVLQKENPNDPEFVVPAKLKELIQKKDFGRYAMPNGEMPACFLTTNDITGGNSGSPVMNADGQLIGAAFDGNWESLSGDLNFDNNLQRCICVDIRYILFIVDKLGGCSNLINEMTLN
jgi:hypothetical protein